MPCKLSYKWHVLFLPIFNPLKVASCACSTEAPQSVVQRLHSPQISLHLVDQTGTSSYMGGDLEQEQWDFPDLKKYYVDKDTANLRLNTTDLLRAFFAFLEQERVKESKEKPVDLHKSLLLLLLCVATLLTFFTVFFFWRSKYGVRHVGGMCIPVLQTVRKSLATKSSEMNIARHDQGTAVMR